MEAAELSEILYPSKIYFPVVTSHANHLRLKAAFTESIKGRWPGLQQQQPVQYVKNHVYRLMYLYFKKR